LATGLQEGEIRKGIEQGGHVRTVVIVSKCVGKHTEHLAYFLTSWKRVLLPLRVWNDMDDRTYRDLDRLLTLIRVDFGFRGGIPLYITGDPELAKYKALAREGGAATGPVPPHCGQQPASKT
jgi:hypothetical protein